MVTRASLVPEETQAGLAGLGILVDLGRLDLPGREGTRAALGPGDSRE